MHAPLTMIGQLIMCPKLKIKLRLSLHSTNYVSKIILRWAACCLQIAVLKSGEIIRWGIHPFSLRRKIQSLVLSSEKSTAHLEKFLSSVDTSDEPACKENSVVERAAESSTIDTSAAVENMKDRTVIDRGDCTDIIVQVVCGFIFCFAEFYDLYAFY